MYFTLEIDKTPIAVFEAELLAAGETDEGQAFHEDLCVLEWNGRPLWDGESRHLLNLRPASKDERHSWELTKRDEDWICFLVPVTDPTDD